MIIRARQRTRAKGFDLFRDMSELDIGVNKDNKETLEGYSGN